MFQLATFPQVDAVIAWTRTAGAVAARPFEEPALQRLMARVRGADAAERAAILAALLPALDAADAMKAACVAVCCGTAVEWGVDPAIAGGAVVRRLDVAVRDDSDASAIKLLAVAAMAHLARSVGLRRAARRLDGLADRLAAIEDRVHEAWYVRTALSLLDDLELLVLAPAARRGYRLRVEAVKSNFHLFTLVQGALIGDPDDGWLAAEPCDADVLAIARGEARDTGRADHARFHFYQASALTADGVIGAGLAGSIWGEGTPRELATRHDGAAVMLVGPTVLGTRGWSSGFFAAIHGALRSRAEVIATLTPAEVDAALAALR